MQLDIIFDISTYCYVETFLNKFTLNVVVFNILIFVLFQLRSIQYSGYQIAYCLMGKWTILDAVIDTWWIIFSFATKTIFIHWIAD